MGLYDRRIVSYVIRDKNNNALVFDNVDNALLRNPGAQPRSPVTGDSNIRTGHFI